MANKLRFRDGWAIGRGSKLAVTFKSGNNCLVWVQGEGGVGLTQADMLLRWGENSRMLMLT